MSLKQQCPNPSCGKSYSVSQEHVGRKTRCPACQREMTIGDPSIVVVPKEATGSKHGSGDTLRAAASQQETQFAAERIGRFEIKEQLGAGAFGEVYRAYDRTLDREVALKVPKAATVGSTRALDRFLREGKAAAQLRHPHIVPVYDAGQADGKYYIASAFINGQPLAELIVDEPLEPRRTATIVRSLAEALSYAHEQRIVHRDIKPDNVMIDQAGQPHLMDFGLARFAESADKMTQDGTVLGTASYMAPEQARGDLENVGPLSDQYSLGVVLYELLTGQTPFSGPPQVVLFHVLETEPPAPHTIRKEIPLDLETICLRAMAKEPSRRYPDCRALAEDLRRFLENEPIAARRLRPAERLIRWCRRNPVVAGLTVALFGVLTLGAIVSGLLAAQSAHRASLAQQAAQRADDAAEDARRETERAQREATRAQQEATRAEAREQESRQFLYAANMNLAQSAWEESDIGRTRQLLSLYAPGTKDAELRGFEWFHWDRQCHTEVRAFRNSLSVTTAGFAFSPDGASIATATNGEIKLYEVGSGRELLSISPGGNVMNVAFSPSGRQIASAAYTQPLKIWDVKTGQVIQTIGSSGDEMFTVHFSHDGQRIAATTRKGRVKLWNVSDSLEIVALNAMSLAVDASFSPDDTQLATAGLDGTVRLWNLADGTETFAVCPAAGPVGGIAFSPDGKKLATGNSDHTVKVWNAADGQEILTLRGHVQSVAGVAFSPDGARIISGSDDRTVKIWNAVTGEALATLKGNESRVYRVAFSPDGSRIASGGYDSAVRIWDASADREPRNRQAHASALSGLAFMSNDQRVVTAGADGFVKQWETDSGRELFQINCRSVVHQLAISPDEATIAAACEDKTVKLWKTNTGETCGLLTGHTTPVFGVAISLDNARVASLSTDGELRLWNAKTSQLLASIPALATTTGHLAGRCLAFSPDGKHLAFFGHPAVKICDSKTGQQIQVLAGRPNNVNCVAFSPDGKWIAAGHFDGTIQLWDAASGQERLTLLAHTERVNCIVFSPDSARLASASNDRTAKLWDVASGQQVLTLKGHSPNVTRIAFSSDGNLIATGGGNGEIKLWDARPRVGLASSDAQ